MNQIRIFVAAALSLVFVPVCPAEIPPCRPETQPGNGTAAAKGVIPYKLRGVELVGILRVGDNAAAIFNIPVPGTDTGGGRPEMARHVLRQGQSVPTTGFYVQEILDDSVVLAKNDGKHWTLKMADGEI